MPASFAYLMEIAEFNSFSPIFSELISLRNEKSV